MTADGRVEFDASTKVIERRKLLYSMAKFMKKKVNENEGKERAV